MRQGRYRSKNWKKSLATASFLCILFLTGILLSGCGSVFMGQVAVPNTTQRLVVGHDGGPLKRVWVIDGDKVEDVKVEEEVRP